MRLRCCSDGSFHQSIKSINLMATGTNRIRIDGDLHREGNKKKNAEMSSLCLLF